MTRLYLPASLASLRTLLAGEPTPTADAVVAAGDDEESEYLALMTAADASGDALAGPGRRVVVVAEVPGAAPEQVRLTDVVAVHADPDDRGPGADPDDDLAWFGVQEIDALLVDG